MGVRSRRVEKKFPKKKWCPCTCGRKKPASSARIEHNVGAAAGETFAQVTPNLSVWMMQMFQYASAAYQSALQMRTSAEASPLRMTDTRLTHCSAYAFATVRCLPDLTACDIAVVWLFGIGMAVHRSPVLRIRYVALLRCDCLCAVRLTLGA